MTKWQKVKLGDVCECLGKGEHPASFSDIKGTYPFIVSGLSEKKCNGYDNDDECFIIGDGGCANIHYVNGKYAASDHTYIFKSKDDRILTKYIYKYLSGNIRILEDGFKGAGIKNISKSYIMSILIPLPPKEEQERIAKELDAVSDLLAKQKQLLNEQDTLIKSVFYDMFGDPVTNDKGWFQGKIKDIVADIQYGTSEKAGETGTFPILRMNNISYTGEMNYSDLKYINMPSDNKYMLQKGDILFNRTNSKELVGKTGLFDIDKPMVYAGYLIRLRTKDTCLPIFLKTYMNLPQLKIYLREKCKNIVGMANINAKELQDISMYIPPLPLQQKFADIVDQIETQKQKIKSAITKTETLFNALMAKYFDEE